MNFAFSGRGIPPIGSVKASGDDKQLVDLLVRLLFRMFPGAPGGGGDVEVIAGAAPEEVMARVPLPEGCRIVGSTRSSQNSLVVLEVGLTIDQAKEFYEAKLSEAGWSKPESPLGLMPGGFEYQFMEQAMGLTFCGGESGPVLTIRFMDRGDGLTDVLLNYQPSAQNTICDKRQQQRQNRMMRFESVIPNLSAPTGDMQMPGNMGNGDEHAASQAHLRSDKPLAEIAEYYQAQLEKAGWTRVENKASADAVEMSAYEFKDEDGDKWQAFFSVMERPDQKGFYYLLIDAREVRDDEGNSFRGAGFFWNS